jgi:hypothetical protein
LHPFIDHNAREVYNGSRLGKEFSANAFEQLFNGSDSLSYDTPHAGHGHRHEQASTVEAALGMFDFSPSGPPDEEDRDEDTVQQKKRKKKKRRYISL